jgi:hypothetical protein
MTAKKKQNVMKKIKMIYIVTSGSYSDYHIDAIFSTPEKAVQYTESKDYYNIETYPIDVPPTLRGYYIVEMKQDGTVVHATFKDEVPESYDTRIWFRYDDEWKRDHSGECEPIPVVETTLVSTVITHDENRAIKVTGERRGIILAQNLWGKSQEAAALFDIWNER